MLSKWWNICIGSFKHHTSSITGTERNPFQFWKKIRPRTVESFASSPRISLIQIRKVPDSDQGLQTTVPSSAAASPPGRFDLQRFHEMTALCQALRLCKALRPKCRPLCLPSPDHSYISSLSSEAQCGPPAEWERRSHMEERSSCLPLSPGP